MIDFSKDDSKYENKDKIYYQLLNQKLPKMIKTSIDNTNYLVKGSTGTGRKTHYPWIGIFHQQISKGAQKGIYIAYLFRSNMKGVYLSLTQGFTFFEQTFKNHIEVIEKSTNDYKEYFASDQIFSKKPIDLNSKKGSLGRGYEQTTIISKYYSFDSIDSYDIEADLGAIIDRYEHLIGNKNAIDYELEIDDKAYSKRKFHEKIDESFDSIEKHIADFFKDEEKLSITTLEEVNAPKGRGFTTKKHKVIQPKLDYIEKAKEDQQTGLVGEKLILEYEKNRLQKLGRPDLVDKIEWTSEKSDSYGYDIHSFDIDQNGEEYRIFIEVKTTKNNDKPFPITQNEIETSKLYKNRYRLYRVYDINDETQKVYKIYGDLTTKLELKPLNFIAKTK